MRKMLSIVDLIVWAAAIALLTALAAAALPLLVLVCWIQRAVSRARLPHRQCPAP